MVPYYGHTTIQLQVSLVLRSEVKMSLEYVTTVKGIGVKRT